MTSTQSHVRANADNLCQVAESKWSDVTIKSTKRRSLNSPVIAPIAKWQSFPKDQFLSTNHLIGEERVSINAKFLDYTDKVAIIRRSLPIHVYGV